MTDNKIDSAYFPCKALPKIFDKPMFKSIYDTHALLKQNASNIPTSLAGRNHGLLALFLDHIKYKALTEQV